MTFPGVPYVANSRRYTSDGLSAPLPHHFIWTQFLSLWLQDTSAHLPQPIQTLGKTPFFQHPGLFMAPSKNEDSVPNPDGLQTLNPQSETYNWY